MKPSLFLCIIYLQSFCIRAVEPLASVTFVNLFASQFSELSGYMDTLLFLRLFSASADATLCVRLRNSCLGMLAASAVFLFASVLTLVLIPHAASQATEWKKDP